MNTPRPCARDVEVHVWQGNTSSPPPPRPNQSPPLTSRLSGLAEPATRAISVNAVVFLIHLALLKYVFLAS